MIMEFIKKLFGIKDESKVMAWPNPKSTDESWGSHGSDNHYIQKQKRN